MLKCSVNRGVWLRSTGPSVCGKRAISWPSVLTRLIVELSSKSRFRHRSSSSDSGNDTIMAPANSRSRSTRLLNTKMRSPVKRLISSGEV
ncbi:hypothetical protein D3C72_2353590 [compost metagenome]